jgi:hypothetical protein
MRFARIQARGFGMKRILVTWFVGLGIVVAGAVQTTLHEHARAKRVLKVAGASPSPDGDVSGGLEDVRD